MESSTPAREQECFRQEGGRKSGYLLFLQDFRSAWRSLGIAEPTKYLPEADLCLPVCQGWRTTPTGGSVEGRPEGVPVFHPAFR